MDLSIIILSYNTKDITDECLERLQLSVKSCQEKFNNKIQVVVLDNASIDSSAEIIKRNHSWVDLIESKENTGYSKGNNIALKKVKYPKILFLNSDVFVENDTLEKALLCFKNPLCHGIGVKLFSKNGTFQPSAGNLPNLFNMPMWILGLSKLPGFSKINPYHPADESFFKNICEVGWVTGAFFMIRKEVLDKVGGFDEKLFMYAEEVELCKRIENAGFKIWFIPTISVTHLHSASSNFDTTKALVSELKGLKYFFDKYYPHWSYYIKLFFIFGLILRIIVFTFILKFKKVKAYAQGLKVICKK